MTEEIERKFLVDANKLPELSNPKKIKQGYLVIDPQVRVRIVDDQKAYITLKFPSDIAEIVRKEFEYEIPLEEGKELYKQCKATLEKARYNLDIEGKTWEIDVLEGRNKGLVVAEIVLNNITEEFEAPEFIVEEVSLDMLYTNVSLATYPFQDWHYYAVKR